ncbi:MAG: heme exporter protein CcmB [Alphaproteobacteria bacterium]|nr:heme exporter protein CcmB [Alphaproteobacteria bacterium]
MKSFAVLVRRDLRLKLRHGGDSAMVLVFFVLCVALFPLGIGPETNLLARMGPGIVWVTALLASMLALDQLFRADYEDGSLEQIVLGPLPLEMVVVAKALAHWLIAGFPLVALSPVMALMLGLEAAAYGPLVLTMALGTPVLTLIGAIGAALALGARQGGILVALLVLPLYIPVLIFGAGTIDAAIAGLPVQANLLILAGLFLFALAIGPWAGAAAIRQALT